MAWELLYNLSWQLPTEELEGAWKDATGQTAVMKVSSFPHDSAQGLLALLWTRNLARFEYVHLHLDV